MNQGMYDGLRVLMQEQVRLLKRIVALLEAQQATLPEGDEPVHPAGPVEKSPKATMPKAKGAKSATTD